MLDGGEVIADTLVVGTVGIEVGEDIVLGIDFLLCFFPALFTIPRPAKASTITIIIKISPIHQYFFKKGFLLEGSFFS
ncbi:TPA: hypothetical protein DDW69_04265 [candidate division CPR2 bacterium]|nr:MAG: hypothetical protein A2Y26_04950 [candidate division CPR2 bacterium GWD2_39_7]HBG82018.1 hypothetical protein [candidate division CPR2 bacterium]